MERIIQVLKNNNCKQWKIMQEDVVSKEWFFILKKLDMSRKKKVAYAYITVYVSDETTMGSATSKISLQASDEELDACVKQLKLQASLVKNPVIELVREQEQVETNEALGSLSDITQLMKDFKETDDLFVNSYELFEVMTTRHIMNSEGLDVTYSYPSHELELVINAKDDQHEIEIYSDYRFGTCDKESLAASLELERANGEDRKHALKTWKPTKNMPVILSGTLTSSIFNYYIAKTNLDMKYRGLHKNNPGDVIAPEFMHIKTKAMLPHSSMNKAYDDDGRLVKDLTLIEAGRIVDMHGSHTFSSYLGVKDSSVANNFIVSGGEKSIVALREGNYLEVVSMSSFMVNPMTGDFMGEIRLGYLHDENGTQIITGGAISGNMASNADFEISKEVTTRNHMICPAHVKLHHVAIAS